ncbi:MAG: hypothetical protein LUD77_04050 [Clostridiales bacterium]|nr:hypothetical protein [Clostridiales bacterium]
MKRFLAVFTVSVFMLSGCGGSEGGNETAGENETAETEETADENEPAETEPEESEGSKSKSGTEEPEVGHDGEIASENDMAEDAFDYFFKCYSKTETADNVTKSKRVEMVMFEDSDDPYSIDSETYIEKAKNGDDYDAYMETSDVVDEQTNESVSTYTDGFLYYEYDGGLYKQEYESYDEIRKIVDGYYFQLYDYTVNNVLVTNYIDGYKKIEFGFDLKNLSEAPDEFIFEILSATASTYKNLSFNDASFEGYVSPEGYVTSYVMYYDGQVKPGDGTDVYPFKYRTTVSYFDINNTKVETPDNPEDYTLIIVDEDEEEQY